MWGIKGSFVEKMRKTEISKVILPLGYQYVSASSLPKEILSISHFNNQENLNIDHVVIGNNEKSSFVFFDVSYYEELTDQTYASFFKSYIAFNFEVHFPDAEIEPKNNFYHFFMLIGKLISYFVKKRLPALVDFSEDKQFNKRYSITCSDSRKLKQMISYDFRKELCQCSDSWNFWLHDKWIIMIPWDKDCTTGDQRIMPRDIKKYVKRCHDIVVKLNLN